MTLTHGDKKTSLTISVILCTYTANRWDELLLAVESVQNQTYTAHEIILVIDHNPALLEQARAQIRDVIIIENRENRGLSGARNTGISVAKGDVIAFLDDDAVAEPDWLFQLVKQYNLIDVIGIGGSIQPLWERGRPGWFPPEFDWVVGCTYLGMPESITAVRNLIGANMSFRRRIFSGVGGFRSDMGRVGTFPVGCEETELCIRARQQRAQNEILFEPAARVLHHVPANRARIGYFLSRCYGEGRSKAQLSRLVGSKDSLSNERKYTFKTLPQGILNGIKKAFFHLQPAGLAQAAAIICGLTVTALGYTDGLLSFMLHPGKISPNNQFPNETATHNSSYPPALRVLMVTPRFFPEMGGVENHVYQVSRWMTQMGLDVTVLTTDTSGSLAIQDHIAGIAIERVRAYPTHKDYYFAPKLYQTIRRGKWDIIHIQSYHTFVPPIAMVAALRSHIPYVVTFHAGGHSSRWRNAIRQMQRLFLRPLLIRSKRLIALAKFEIDLYSHELKIPTNKFIQIPNGSDLPKLSPSTVKDRKDGILIVSVGRLEKYKGHQRILAAMPYILNQKPDAHLWIIGSGPYETPLTELANKLGVTDHTRIEAIPPGDREAMALALSEANLVVLLSEFETHPIAALEALALHRPVLVADTSGLSELAKQGLVSAVPLNSTSQQVAEAVLQQLDSPLTPPDLVLPTWNDCATKLVSLYQEITLMEV